MNTIMKRTAHVYGRFSFLILATSLTFTTGCNNQSATEKQAADRKEREKQEAIERKELDKLEAEVRAKDDKREKALKCYNNYVNNLNEYVKHWNSYIAIQNTGSTAQRRPYLSDARAAIQKIEPNQPLGVDGGLAAAISDFKLAATSHIDHVNNGLGSLFYDYKEDKRLDERMNRAKDKIGLELNRIASEVGQIELIGR